MTAAAALFAEQGYRATTMRDIARELGVTPGAIYAHFSSKQDLLLAVYRLGVTMIGERVDMAVKAAGTPWERLEAAFRAHIESLVDASPFASVIVRILPGDAPEIGDRLIALRDDYEDRFKRLFDDLDTQRDQSLPRLLALGALNWVPAWYAPGGESPAAIAAALCALLRGGARAGEPAP